MTKENLHLIDPNQNSIGRLTIWPRDLLVVVFVVTLFIIFRQEHYSINVPDDMFFAYMEDPFNALGIATGVIGRYSASIGYIIFEKFSFNYHGTLVALNALGIVSFSIFSVAFCRLCAIDASTTAVVLASLMIALHPYNTENFDHDVNQLNTAIGYTALTFAIWAFAKRSGANWMIIGTILLVVVASSYQPMTYYFLVFVTAISLLKLENAKQIWTNVIRGYSMLAVALAAYIRLFTRLRFHWRWMTWRARMSRCFSSPMPITRDLSSSTSVTFRASSCRTLCTISGA